MECPTPTTLERFWSGSEKAVEIQGHVSICAKCRETIRIWECDRKAFLQKYPFERFERETVSTKSLLSKLWRQIITYPFPVWKTSFACATIAAMAVILLIPRQEQNLILSKGGTSLGFYVVRGNEIQTGRDQMKLAPDDEMKFYYSSERSEFLLLVGIEEDGALSVYYPFGGGESQPISKGSKVFLREAIRWKPHTSSEKFYAIFSEKPVSTSEIGSYIKDSRLESALALKQEIEKAGKPSTRYSVIGFTIYRDEN